MVIKIRGFIDQLPPWEEARPNLLCQPQGTARSVRVHPQTGQGGPEQCLARKINIRPTAKVIWYALSMALQRRLGTEGNLLPAKRQIAFLYATKERDAGVKKELPEYKQVNAQVLQDCLQRLDDAFQRLFSGLAGYPHYKDRDHYRSFTYPQADKQDHFKKRGYIYLPKIGYVKINAHFVFDPSKVSRINVKYHNGKMVCQLNFGNSRSRSRRNR